MLALAYLILKLSALSCFAEDDIKVHEIPAISYDHFPMKLDNFLADEWIAMTPLESLNYYTKKEVCEVTRGDINGKCAMFISEMDYCSISSTGFGHINGYCENTRGSFLRHKSIRAWPESENELDVVRMMREQGSNTIVVMGDSVAAQHILETNCNLRRFGVKVKPVREQWASIQCLPITNSYELINPFGEGPNDGLPYFQFIFVHPVQHMASAHEFEVMYRNITESINSMPLVKGKVMYIYNFGLHYFQGSSEIDVVANVTTQIFVSAAKQGHTVIFRETSAQHFHTPSGLYEPNMAVKEVPWVSAEKKNKISPVAHYYKRLNSEFLRSQAGKDSLNFDNMLNDTGLQFIRCKRIESEEMLDLQNWRNKRVLKYLIGWDPTHELIGIAPHYRVSAARNDLHLHSSRGIDCTHFCMSPMLWAPVWDFIAKFCRKKHLAQDRK